MVAVEANEQNVENIENVEIFSYVPSGVVYFITHVRSIVVLIISVEIPIDSSVIAVVRIIRVYLLEVVNSIGRSFILV